MYRELIQESLDYIEDNFDHKYLVMMTKYQERIKCIDQEINPDIKDVETMMYVECMSFDEELRAYFQDKNIPYQSSLDDTCMHIQIDGRGYNTQLIYDEHFYTDYVNLYKIIYEYSWLRKYEDLIDYLLDKVEDLRENEYTIKRT